MIALPAEGIQIVQANGWAVGQKKAPPSLCVRSQILISQSGCDRRSVMAE
jgi:hypothetical protein